MFINVLISNFQQFSRYRVGKIYSSECVTCMSIKVFRSCLSIVCNRNINYITGRIPRNACCTSVSCIRTALRTDVNDTYQTGSKYKPNSDKNACWLRSVRTQYNMLHKQYF